ncbi:MAG: hypothetical protein ACE5EV_05145, partial [Gaiellales bacterium]
GAVRLLLNDGAGGLVLQPPVPVGAAVDLAVTSLLGSGALPDLLVLGSNGSVQGIEEPAGRLGLLDLGTVGTSATAFVVGDVDDRNGPDAVVVDAAAGTVRLALNDGENLLEPRRPVAVGAQPTALVLTDFDR